MSATINVPKIRVGSSIPMAITLTDNGVAVDWSSVGEIAVLLYFEGKKLFGGKCTYEVSGTTLNVVYSADKPQFLGIADVVINCKYLGMEKTFDRPVVEFVATTAEATGQSQITRDPLAVDIDVEDVDTSLLDAAIHAAVAAAAQAMEAAEAANSAAGPYIDETTGDWFVWDPEVGDFVDSGVHAQGEQGVPGVASVTASVDSGIGTPSVDVSLIGTALSLIFHNLKGAKGDTGDPGIRNVEVSVDDTTGTPSVVSSLVNGLLSMAFSGLKGTKGDTGNPGITNVEVSVDGTTGTPSVVSTLVNGLLSLAFSGLKGAKGDTGNPGVTSAQASVDSNVGTPGVSVSLNNGVLSFAFTNLKGAKGDTGNPGVTSAQASVDANVGTPGVSVSLNNGVLSFAFTNLKGDKGDKGDTGGVNTVNGQTGDVVLSIPDGVEANPTVPQGTTPTALSTLKIGSNYFSVPDVASLTTSEIDTIISNVA